MLETSSSVATFQAFWLFALHSLGSGFQLLHILLELDFAYQPFYHWLHFNIKTHLMFPIFMHSTFGWWFAHYLSSVASFSTRLQSQIGQKFRSRRKESIVCLMAILSRKVLDQMEGLDMTAILDWIRRRKMNGNNSNMFESLLKQCSNQRIGTTKLTWFHDSFSLSPSSSPL